MSNFEDGLWSDLVREHGSELALAPRPARRRLRRGVPLTAGALVVAGAMIAAALILTAGTSPPAYAVSENSDGTVTVTINELLGVSGANAELVRLGVRATVARVEPGCNASANLVPGPPPLATKMVHPDRPGVMTIDPSLIPPGDTLRISAERLSSGPPAAVGLGIALYRGPAPACVPSGDSQSAGR